MTKAPGFLAVGNFDSNVGYAWRLMESFWCQISQQLQPLGYQPHLCFPSLSIIPDCLTKAGFTVSCIDFTKDDIASLLRQVQFIRQHNIKLIYLTDFKTSGIRYFLYRLAGVKRIIIHDHSPGTRTQPSSSALLIKKLLHNLRWLSADSYFAVSPFVKQRMIAINGIPERKIHCIPNGIPASSERPVHTAGKTINIVSVARANYYKGIDFAIQVIAQLLKTEQSLPITYTLYGDGPNLEDFQKLAHQLNVSGHIIFAGKVDKVPEKLLQADIAFHPSRGEAMSLAILEYMRAGLPVVVSDNPSVGSFLLNRKTGMIYKENSIDSAVQTLQELINSEELRSAIGNNAWDAINEQFNDSLMYKTFNSSILKVLS